VLAMFLFLKSVLLCYFLVMIQHNLKAVWFYLPPDLIYVSPTDPISVLAFCIFKI